MQKSITVLQFDLFGLKLGVHSPAIFLISFSSSQLNSEATDWMFSLFAI